MPKENTQNVSLTIENLPKELLDKMSTGYVEKIVRILLTDKNIARYLIKDKQNGKRSERKKGDWYAVVNINLDTNKQKSLPVNMENDETTVENNDCDVVEIGGAEQSLSHENRSWNFFNSVFFSVSRSCLFHTNLFHFHFALFIYFKIAFLQP